MTAKQPELANTFEALGRFCKALGFLPLAFFYDLLADAAEQAGSSTHTSDGVEVPNNTSGDGSDVFHAVTVLRNRGGL